MLLLELVKRQVSNHLKKKKIELSKSKNCIMILVRESKVGGSNPPPATKYNECLLFLKGISGLFLSGL